MKALEILKKIYANNPDTRFQRNNIDINFTIHDFSNVNEAIKELEALENKFKREQENNLSSEIAKTETILGLKKHIEAIENRSCDNCKFALALHKDPNVSHSEFCCMIDSRYNNKDFYCNKWESK